MFLITSPKKVYRIANKFFTASFCTFELFGYSKLQKFMNGKHFSPHKKSEFLSDYSKKFCDYHGILVDPKGDQYNGVALYIANHLSYLDPITISSKVPCLGISKAEIAEWPFIGHIAQNYGFLLYRRGNPMNGAKILKKMMVLLKNGVSILNFPEGTTTTGDKVLPFFRGSFGIAKILDIPIIPVRLYYEDPCIAWVGNELLLPHYLRTASMKNLKACITFFPPVFPSKFNDVEQLAEYCRKTISLIP